MGPHEGLCCICKVVNIYFSKTPYAYTCFLVNGLTNKGGDAEKKILANFFDSNSDLKLNLQTWFIIISTTLAYVPFYKQSIVLNAYASPVAVKKVLTATIS